MNKAYGKIKKPKILSFSHYGQLYGANRSLLTLILASRDRLDWLVICRQEGQFTEELKANAVAYRVIPFKTDVYNGPSNTPKLRGIVKLLTNVRAATHIVSLINSEQVDIIHSNSSVILIGAITAQLAAKKHLWHFREFVYEDYNSKYNLGKSFFRYWARKADTIICISQSIREVRLVQGKVDTRSVIIYNGLVGSDMAQTPRSLANRTSVISIIGVINRAKNQLVAIKALRQLLRSGKRLTLHIAGDINDPEYYGELKTYIQQENLSEYVRFLGFVKDIKTVIAESDVTLMCSRMEAFGRVTVESMMYGVPVVAFASAGSSEIIENGKTGLLYTGEEDDLAEKIDKILSDPVLYKVISENALNHVAKNFTVSSYADNFVNEVNLALKSN
ncbi:glycosyltransferase family 4 protein [Dyadobacter sp.]|uniref:glycosyltransferase family 4 protein n=1 Tax=Dyadobacter sp. TaxID=1914288 RepID=UPI003F716ECD